MVEVVNEEYHIKTMKSIVWILIIVIVACIFLFKRLYGDPPALGKRDIMPILQNTLVCTILVILFYGHEEIPIRRVIIIAFIIGLILLIISVLRFVVTGPWLVMFGKTETTVGMRNSIKDRFSSIASVFKKKP